MPDLINGIGIYETRTMLAAIERFMPVYSFLRDTFFSGTQVEKNEHMDFDYRKGKRKMAPFVAPLMGEKVMDRQGYETKTIKFPKIAPARALTLQDLQQRLPGEEVYGGYTPQERAMQLLASDMRELTEYIDRREEWIAAQLLFTGKIDINIEGADQVIDYDLTNNETVPKKWDAPDSDPIADLKNKRLAVIQKTGIAPDVCIMASDVADAYAKNEAVIKFHDILNYFIGEYRPEIKSPAVTFIERITKLALDVFTYDDWFLEDIDPEDPKKGTKELPFVPPGHVLLARKEMPSTKFYGPVTQMEGSDFRTYMAERVPKVYSDEKADIRMLRMTSRPVFVPWDVDSWYVLKVL